MDEMKTVGFDQLARFPVTLMNDTCFWDLEPIYQRFEMIMKWMGKFNYRKDNEHIVVVLVLKTGADIAPSVNFGTGTNVQDVLITMKPRSQRIFGCRFSL